MTIQYMRYVIIPVTQFQQNCSLLWCEQTRKAVLVDPGGDVERILSVVEKNELELEKIFLTHGHIDHVGATPELAQRFNLPIEGPHRAEHVWLDALPQQSEMFGFPYVAPFSPDRWLEGGDTVFFGQIELEVRYCPGHTPGHIIFFHRESRLAMVGDVLFRGSIGRTNFPGGDHATLIRSIREQLWPLGDDVSFIPGHGSMSTFGEERRNNPFVKD